METLPRLNLEVVQQLLDKCGMTISEYKRAKPEKDPGGWSRYRPQVVGTRSCGVSEITGIIEGNTEMDILCAVADAVAGNKGLVSYYNNPHSKKILNVLQNLGFGITYFKNPVHNNAAIYRADLFIDNLKWVTLANMKPVRSAEAKTTSPATKTAQRGALAATITKNRPKEQLRDRYGRFT